jgi:hypothetical protein
MKSKIKGKMHTVFYAALVARIISIVCLGVFYYSVEGDLSDRTALLSLGVSYTAWLVGSFFVGIYKDGITRSVLETLVSEGEQLEEAMDVEVSKAEDHDDDYPRHPMFDE